MQRNQTCWLNRVVTPNRSMLVFMSLLSRLCFMAVMDSSDREREASSGGHYFFSPWNPCFISPQTHSLTLTVSHFHQERCAVCLFYIMLYQFPLIATHFLCQLSYSHYFPRPTFHLFLWGVFLSHIDWMYLSAAVKLWKWVVSLVILCGLPSQYQQPWRQ